MDSLRVAVQDLGTAAAVAAAVLRSSFRTLLQWTSGIASRHAGLVTILSQSLTLFLLGLVVAHLRDPQARGWSRRLPAPERP